MGWGDRGLRARPQITAGSSLVHSTHPGSNRRLLSRLVPPEADTHAPICHKVPLLAAFSLYLGLALPPHSALLPLTSAPSSAIYSSIGSGAIMPAANSNVTYTCGLDAIDSYPDLDMSGQQQECTYSGSMHGASKTSPSVIFIRLIRISPDVKMSVHTRPQWNVHYTTRRALDVTRHRRPTIRPK